MRSTHSAIESAFFLFTAAVMLLPVAYPLVRWVAR